MPPKFEQSVWIKVVFICDSPYSKCITKKDVKKNGTEEEDKAMDHLILMVEKEGPHSSGSVSLCFLGTHSSGSPAGLGGSGLGSNIPGYSVTGGMTPLLGSIQGGSPHLPVFSPRRFG